MADDERRREEKRNLELKRQKYDIGKQRDRAVRESMDHEAKKHDLTVENNFLKRDFDRELRDHHREKEAIERDHQLQLNMRNLEHNREMNNERLKAEEAKKIEKRMEKLEEEIDNLNKEIEDKKIKNKYEKKIKKMKEDHDKEIAKERAARNALQQSKIQYDRKVKILISVVRSKADHGNMGNNQDLTVENDYLKRNLDREHRDHQLQLNMRNLENYKDMDKVCQAEDAKRKYEKRMEQLEEEIADLNDELEDKNNEITKIEADHTVELNENENRLKTEYEEKIKKMQDDHDQEIAEKETEKMRLTQFVVDNITDDTVNHQLKMERDRLERELGREVREHQREKEAMERDFEQRIFIINLKHEKELRNANGGRNESQSKVEDSQ